MTWDIIPQLVILLVGVGIFVLLCLLTGNPGDNEPYQGDTVVAVNGETALVRVQDSKVVAQNPFPELVVGDVVHVCEQGSGFSPYAVIIKIYCR